MCIFYRVKKNYEKFYTEIISRKVDFLYFFLLKKDCKLKLLLKFQCRTQRARKFKKVLAKKLVKSNVVKNFFRQIAFLAVLNFFSSSKIDFLAIFEIAKNGIWSK